MDIHTSQHTVSADILHQFSHLSSSIISDAMDTLGLFSGGVLPTTIKPITTYTTPLVGQVTTVYAPEGTSLPVHLAMITHATHRILCIATDTYTHNAFLGDIQANLAALNGCKGLVIDGYIRDSQGIKELTMPVYCTGTHPKRPNKKDLGGINIPITMGTIKINPDDILLADADGIVVIPFNHIHDVYEEALKKDEKDNTRLAKVQAFDYTTAQSIQDYVGIVTPDVAEYIKTKL